MKKYITKRYPVFLLLVTVLLGLMGCGDDNTSSDTSGSGNTASEVAVATEEYNYDEFMDDSIQDSSELESIKISKQEAKKIVNQIEHVNKVLNKQEKKFLKKKKITEETLPECLDEIESYLYSHSIEGVSYWNRSDDLISIHLENGGNIIYEPEIEGLKAGGSGEGLQISTYEPFYSELSKGPLAKDIDNAARAIEAEFPQYKFYSDGTSSDNDYNDEEVTLKSILNFSQNSVVIWNGHGGHSDEYGCYISTPIIATEENMQKYAVDLEENNLLISNHNTIMFTASFIDKYFAENSLKNCIFYLGTCSSVKDESIVNVLFSKGAMAVFGYDYKVQTDYDHKMASRIFDRATQKSGDRYYTLDESLEYAKKENGAYCKVKKDDGTTYKTSCCLFYNEGYYDISLDWYRDYRIGDRDIVVVLDRSGSMRGEPLEQTKEAATKFVDTVMQKDSRVSLVTYDSSATVNCSLTRNGEYLKTAINQVEAGGSTNIYDAMEYADKMLSMSCAKKKIIVLMTDGLPNSGREENGSYEEALVQYSDTLKNKGYYLYTLGFFSEVEGEELSQAQQMLGDMASPGYHYEVESADDLVFFFDDIASQIGGTKYVYIRIACPVDVTVKSNGEILTSEADSENTRTSFGTLTYENLPENTEENQNNDDYDEYSEDEISTDQAKILRLKMDKDYDIDIQGYDTGTMDYTVSYPNENGEYDDVRKFPNISVSPSTKAVSNTEQADASYLEIDKNGDGKYETTYKTESNGTMEVVKDYTVLYICLGVGAVLITTVVIVIIVVAKKRKKRKAAEPEPIQKKSFAVQGAVIGVFGSYYGREYPLTAGVSCVVGRESSSNIQLLHKNVSRIHCTIQLLPDGQYQVVDFSSNGTFYNNERLQSGIPYKIPGGALLAIGDADNVLQLR